MENLKDLGPQSENTMDPKSSDEKPNVSDDNGKRGPRIDKRFNIKLGKWKSALKSKEQKLERLQSERDNLSSDLERGYEIVENSETGKKEQIKLSSIDRKIVVGKIKELDNDIFDTNEEISDLEDSINDLQDIKNDDLGNKLGDKRHKKTVSNLTASILKIIDASSENGEPDELVQIKEQLSQKDNNAANKSLIQFLGTRNSSIKKRLDKSRKEVREEAISNTLQKLTVS